MSQGPLRVDAPEVREVTPAASRFLQDLERLAASDLSVSNEDEENSLTRDRARERRALRLELLRVLPDVFRDVEREAWYGITDAAA